MYHKCITSILQPMDAEISKNDMNLNCENFNIEYLNLNPAFDIQEN